MSAVFRLLLAAAFLVPAAALGLPTVRSPAQFAPRSNVRMTEDTPKSSPLPRSTSSPMVNIEQKKLAWPYFAAVIAAGCLATGGIFEDQVAELFEPVSSKGGWAGALGINPPGQPCTKPCLGLVACHAFS